MNTKLTRRNVLIASAVAGPAALLAGNLIAAENRLSPDDAQAKALGYVEDAAAVDTAAWPRKQPDQNCANCALYQGEADGWGACSIFPGKVVAGPGWCNVWAPKA